MDIFDINNFNPSEDSFKAYFEDEEWNGFSDLEKRRLMNVKRNYDLMKSIGLNPKPPDFMLSTRRTKENPAIDINSDGGEMNDKKKDSTELTKDLKTLDKIQTDGETEEVNTRTNPGSSRFPEESKIENGADGETAGETQSTKKKRLRGLELCLKLLEKGGPLNEVKLSDEGKRSVSFITDMATKLKDSMGRIFGKLDRVETPPDSSDDEEDPEPRSRYPRRNVPKVCYKEEDISSDDDYLYCDECGREFDVECPVHGPLIHIMDRKAQHGPRYAWDTCPSILSVGRSGIKGAGLGVWAERDLSIGMVFGPYEGKVVKSLKEAKKGGYSWQIRKGGRVHHYLDAADPSASNWMRFVNCAPYEYRQNLTAFQYEGRVYYKTYKEVAAFTELTVWYGDEFAQDMGIDITEDEPTPSSDPAQRGEIEACVGDAVAYKRSRSSLIPKNSDCAQKFRYAVEAEKRVKQTGIHLRRSHSAKSGGKENERPVSNPKEVTSNREHKTRPAQARCYGDQQSKCNNYANSELNGDSNSRERVPPNKFRAKETDTNADQCSRKSDAFFLNLKRKLSEENVTINKFPSWKFSSRHESHVSHQQKKILRSADRREANQTRGGCMLPSTMNEKPPNKVQNSDQSSCDYFRVLHSNSLHMKKDAFISEGTSSHPVCGRRQMISTPQQTGSSKSKGEVRQNPPPDCLRAQGISLQMRTNAARDRKEKVKCPQCDYSTQLMKDLRRHISAVHEGKRPNKCEHCDYRAARASNLQKHISAVHEGKKPYKCEHCDYRAAEASSLQTHISEVHEGKRPHKCEHCDYRAARASSLQKHINAVHDGNRPYKCQYCHYAASQSGHLRIHTRRIHEGKEVSKL